jgi:hypothetical protein
MRYLLGLILACLFSLQAIAADSQSTTTAGTESLGNKLLDDLAPISPPATNSDSQPGTANEQPEPKPLAPNSSLLAPPASPFTRVQQGMQNAQTLLAQPGPATHSGTIKLAGSVQQGVVSELDKLIAQLSKQCQCQCQGGQCDKPPNPNAKPKPGSKPGMAAGRGKSAARDSTDRLDRTTAQPVDKGDVNDVVKELWGHLPERSREQMLQSFSDDFLPKYELEIEQYYRKLGEEQEKTSDVAPPTK